MSLEVIVVLMSLNSCLERNFSETRIRVPSERTTRSRGDMRKAKGSARHSMIKKAMYVSGVTPPVTPLTWFFDKLCRWLEPLVHVYSQDTTSDMTYLIAPPTNWPKFLATIHSARYFPRDPDGARDIMVPDSATYHVPVPMPVKKPPRMRYHWLPNFELQ